MKEYKGDINLKVKDLSSRSSQLKVTTILFRHSFTRMPVVDNKFLAPSVQTVDSTIHLINLCEVE